MAKQTGLGALLVYAGYNISNDIGSGEIAGGQAVIDVTGIDKSAHERIGGLRDGRMSLMAFFNDATDKAHDVFSGLSTADRIATYADASAIGAPAASIIGKQIDYPPTRAADGSLTFSIPHAANGYALEWGDLLTAGLRTDTSATNGTGLDGAASSSTGWAAYLHVTALTGTNVVVTLEDSADDISYAVFTSSAFTSVTTPPSAERIAGAAGATVRRYVRAVTSGTFSSATFLVAFTRSPAST